jgi:hypothetical protein
MTCTLQHPIPADLKYPSQGMTTRSVFMEQVVPFIYDVKFPLNASHTNIPHFLKNIPGYLSHITANQSFISSMVSQTLGWHMTVIPLHHCSLGIVLRFSITYGGTLLPSANTAYRQLLAALHELMFQ